MLFGEKEPAKTLLILDVENGSVGAALVRVRAGEAPRLFAERRVHLPVRLARSAQDVFAGVKQASHKVLGEIAHVAARLRQHQKTAPAGQVEGAAIFLSAPWGMPNLALGKPRFSSAATEMLNRELGSFFEVPSAFYTSAGALYRGAQQLMPYERDHMLVGVLGETSEILQVKDGVVVGHATFPTGSHAALRTLRTHADLMPAQARELLSRTPLLSEYQEPLSAASQHFASSFAAAAESLLRQGSTARVYTAAHTGSDFFARALAESKHAGALFPRGGTVRALRPEHAMPHLAAHAEHPDLWLMLEALFATAL